MSGERIDAIRERIVQILANKLGCDVSYINEHRRFETYGLGSIDALDLMGDLEQWLDLELSPTLAGDYPTVAELSAHVASLATDAR
jgi:acyl carrier protein